MTHLDSAKEVCRDLNECFLETHNCHENADCTNSIGSFECTCNDGFSGNGTMCDNNDECSTGDVVCPEFTDCLDIIGGFECRKGNLSFINVGYDSYQWYDFLCNFFVRCKDGFKVVGTQCVDVDECRDECASRSQVGFQPNFDDCHGPLVVFLTFLVLN